MNMSYFSIITPFSILLIALTSANESLHSAIQAYAQNQLNIDQSPTGNNLLTGFDCKNLTNIEFLELEKC